MVGPKVAAAAAQRALEVLAEEDPAVAAEAVGLASDAEAAQDKDQAQQDRSAAPGQQASSPLCSYPNPKLMRHWLMYNE